MHEWHLSRHSRVKGMKTLGLNVTARGNPVSRTAAAACISAARGQPSVAPRTCRREGRQAGHHRRRRPHGWNSTAQHLLQPIVCLTVAPIDSSESNCSRSLLACAIVACGAAAAAGGDVRRRRPAAAAGHLVECCDRRVLSPTARTTLQAQ